MAANIEPKSAGIREPGGLGGGGGPQLADPALEESGATHATFTRRTRTRGHLVTEIGTQESDVTILSHIVQAFNERHTQPSGQWLFYVVAFLESGNLRSRSAKRARPSRTELKPDIGNLSS